MSLRRRELKRKAAGLALVPGKLAAISCLYLNADVRVPYSARSFRARASVRNLADMTSASSRSDQARGDRADLVHLLVRSRSRSSKASYMYPTRIRRYKRATKPVWLLSRRREF